MDRNERNPSSVVDVVGVAGVVVADEVEVGVVAVVEACIEVVQFRVVLVVVVSYFIARLAITYQKSNRLLTTF